MGNKCLSKAPRGADEDHDKHSLSPGRTTASSNGSRSTTSLPSSTSSTSVTRGTRGRTTNIATVDCTFCMSCGTSLLKESAEYRSLFSRSFVATCFSN